MSTIKPETDVRTNDKPPGDFSAHHVGAKTDSRAGRGGAPDEPRVTFLRAAVTLLRFYRCVKACGDFRPEFSGAFDPARPP